MALVTAHLSTVGRRARQVLSRRLQASVLTAVLVLSSAAPPSVAVAQEVDQGHEGVAAPEQTTAPDSTANPDFDPGDDTGLPFDVGAPDSADDSGDGAPVDVEPITDPDNPPIAVDDPNTPAPDALSGSNEATPPVEATPPIEAAPPAESVGPAPAPAPAPPPPAATPSPAVDSPALEHEKRATARKPRRDRPHHRRPARVAAPVASPAPAPPAAAPVAATITVEPVAEVVSSAAQDRVRPGDASHTVQSGESLWTIASDLLGAGATDAQIDAETDRLYRLNRDRVGDDPNLLIAGTVLRLR